jgi:MarR-like DNA-binding transcriptional regulator SgrR of sgrS sRNA
MTDDNKLAPAGNLCEEEILNPRVKSMTDEMLKAIPQRDPLTMAMFDYAEPVRDARWFKNRCEQLGIFLPENYYEIMQLHASGIRSKQYRSMLKKERRKRTAKIIHGTKVLSF